MKSAAHDAAHPRHGETPAARKRIQRLRRLAGLLDDSIPLPGGYRIGLDPIIGLIPGLGDVIGAIFSAYIIYEAHSLGTPRSVLLRMMGNVALETLVGTIPILGDLFDAVFKANLRNLELLAQYRLDPMGAERRSRSLVWMTSLLLVVFVGAIIAIPVLFIIVIARQL
jgi:hypothetical protein